MGGQMHGQEDKMGKIYFVTQMKKPWVSLSTSLTKDKPVQELDFPL